MHNVTCHQRISDASQAAIVVTKYVARRDVFNIQICGDLAQSHVARYAVEIKGRSFRYNASCSPIVSRDCIWKSPLPDRHGPQDDNARDMLRSKRFNRWPQVLGFI